MEVGLVGKPFPRSEFSGGKEINRKLESLGFKIKMKPGVNVSQMSIDDLQPGLAISNDELFGAFVVGNSGGMRWSNRAAALSCAAR